jgi:ABC-type multidrug transport system fused ATPase/permease subunit
VRPYRGRLASGLVLIALSSLAAAAAPRLIGRAVDVLQEAEAGRATEAAILWAAAAFLLFAGVRSLLMAFGRYAVVAASRDLEFDLRQDLYRHMVRLPCAWFDRHPTGDLTSRFLNDLDGVRMMIGFSLTQLAGTVLLFGMCLAGLLLIGTLGGIYIVPMNACLQQVGHRSVGAGKTIAIQNFFENMMMFAGVGAYTLATKAGVATAASLAATGAVLLAMVGYLFVYSRRC